MVGSLNNAMQDEGNKVKSQQSQLLSTAADLEKKKNNHLILKTELQAGVNKAQNEHSEAKFKIKSLEELLDHEQKQTKIELGDAEEKMKAELDDIDIKVKHSFEKLVERKNKEIASALARARAAEASAKGAENLLLELKVHVGPMVATTQATSEN